MTNYGVKVCPHCGTKLTTYIKSGFLGCNYCYDAFAEDIIEELPNTQVKTTYKGKKGSALLNADRQLVVDQLNRLISLAQSQNRFNDCIILTKQLKAIMEND